MPTLHQIYLEPEDISNDPVIHIVVIEVEKLGVNERLLPEIESEILRLVKKAIKEKETIGL